MPWNSLWWLPPRVRLRATLSPAATRSSTRDLQVGEGALDQLVSLPPGLASPERLRQLGVVDHDVRGDDREQPGHVAGIERLDRLEKQGRGSTLSGS